MADSNEHPTHLIVARAAAADPDGASAQARIGMTSEPSQGDLDRYRAAIIELFRKGFDCEPVRVAVVVLPWVVELDADDDTEDEEAADA